jgi:hypothetical protein
MGKKIQYQLHLKMLQEIQVLLLQKWKKQKMSFGARLEALDFR